MNAVLFTILIIFITTVILVILIRSRKNWSRLYSDIFYDALQKIEASTIQFNSLNSFQNGYFSNYKLQEWKKQAEDLLNKINGIPALKRNVSKDNYYILIQYRELLTSSDEIRERYNDTFVQNELLHRRDYFSKILTMPLDDEQRKAIVVDEDHNLIIAGAGCGKTTTITGKVKYIIDKYEIPVDEIALISFTRKSAQEMHERVNHKMHLNVAVETFHSFGLDIIGKGTGRMPSVADERTVKTIINDCFYKNRQNDEFLSKLNTFFLSYLKDPPEEDNINDEDDLRSYLKGNDITSLKEIAISRSGNITYERQFCRSYEEVLIANFLFVNQIKYEYERDYLFDTRTADHKQYKPDFYLPEYDIYIEHYGVDDKGNVPKWFGNLVGGRFSVDRYQEQNKMYNAKMKWADEVHSINKTKLVKTFSWENKKKVLLPSLEEKLKKFDVQFRPLDPKQVWATIVQSAEKDITDFETLLITFLSLIKSNHYSVEQVRQKIKSIDKDFQRVRSEIFLDLFIPIYEGYEKKLKEKNEIDFNDMISNACDIIVAGKYNRRLKYLIVDEFQDISIGRYKLLKEILNYNPGCKLFCVGDDWQSIFRFTGSDIVLFTQFEKFFGVTKTSHITSTYRFSNELIKLSTAFIQKNPNQVRKQLQSKTEQYSNCVQIIYSTARNERDTSNYSQI